MRLLKTFFESNRKWADSVKKKDPNFFMNLSKQQNPEYPWIGCSHSREPASKIGGHIPGSTYSSKYC